MNSSDKFVRGGKQNQSGPKRGKAAIVFIHYPGFPWVKSLRCAVGFILEKNSQIWRSPAFLKDGKPKSGIAAEVTHVVAKENINRQRDVTESYILIVN